MEPKVIAFGFFMPMNVEENPWKTTSTQMVYESPWIAVNKHEVINPAGNPGTYSTIHFKNKAIGILALDEDFNTWIIGQYRYPINAYSWEIPEGGGQLDVAYELSAERELFEETGIKAKKITEIMRLHLSNSASDEEAIVFIAQDLSYHEPEPEETEVLQIRKLPFTELYQMVIDGEVTDAITIAAVLKVDVMIKKNLIM